MSKKSRPITVSLVSHICDIEFSAKEWAKIKKAAKKENKTIEEWMNLAIDNYIKTLPPEIIPVQET
jgi:hypothetical protein